MGKLKDRPIPPCPDPRLYVLITTKEGSYWRLKRGTIKPATVNDQLKASSERMKITSPAAKKVVAALSHHVRDLEVGRLTVRIGALLGKSLKDKGVLDYSAFPGFDFQPDYPLQELAHFGLSMDRTETHIRFKIAMKQGEALLLRETDEQTQVRFAGVIVRGKPDEEPRSASMASANYPVVPMQDGECVLSLPAPPEGEQYFIFLKVMAVENNQVKESPAAKGAQVILAG